MYRYIKAMSDSRKEIRLQLKRQSGEITEHLIKLMLYPNAQERNHWKHEIYAFVHSVPKVKGINKFPSESFIFESLTIYLDNVPGLMWHVKREESDLVPEDANPNLVESIVQDYMEWLAKQLSKYGTVESADVFAKLDELTN